jgi:hypothetical protein
MITINWMYYIFNGLIYFVFGRNSAQLLTEALVEGRRSNPGHNAHDPYNAEIYAEIFPRLTTPERRWAAACRSARLK